MTKLAYPLLSLAVLNFVTVANAHQVMPLDEDDVHRGTFQLPDWIIQCSGVDPYYNCSAVAHRGPLPIGQVSHVSYIQFDRGNVRAAVTAPRDYAQCRSHIDISRVGLADSLVIDRISDFFARVGIDDCRAYYPSREALEAQSDLADLLLRVTAAR